MPDFQVTSPDGKSFIVSAPAGASQDDVLDYARNHAPPATPSLLSRATKNLRAIPGDIGEEFRKGAGMVREGMGSGTLPGAGEALLGGLTEATSPINGTLRALVGDPLRETLPKNRAGQFAANLGEDVASMAGPGILSEASKTVPGLNDAVKLLQKEGVNLTPGRMAGRTARSLESAVASLPAAGSFVKSAEHQMLEDFNRATINRSLKQVGEKLPKDVEMGRDAIGYAERAIGTKYDALLPKLSFQADTQFGTDLAQVLTDYSTQKGQLGKVFTDVIGSKMTVNGTITGWNFKLVESKLSNLARTYMRAQDPDQRHLGLAIQDVRAAMREALERSNPNHADQLQTLNSAWAAFTRVQDASVRRATTGGVFTPGDLLGAIRSGSTKGSFARGHVLLQDLAEAGQKVLPQTIPNSGTVDRAAWLGLLGLGAEGHLPYVTANQAIGAGAATLPYTRPGMAATNWLARTGTEIAPAAQEALSSAPAAATAGIGATGGQPLSPDASSALAAP